MLPMWAFNGGLSSFLFTPGKGAEHVGPQISADDHQRRYRHWNGCEGDAAGANPAGEMTMSVLFPAPTDNATFDKYCFEKHMPPTRDVKGAPFETPKVQPGASGTAPAFYRLTELYFESPGQLRAARSSPELKKVFQDAEKLQPPLHALESSRRPNDVCPRGGVATQPLAPWSRP